MFYVFPLMVNVGRRVSSFTVEARFFSHQRLSCVKLFSSNFEGKHFIFPVTAFYYKSIELTSRPCYNSCIRLVGLDGLTYFVFISTSVVIFSSQCSSEHQTNLSTFCLLSLQSINSPGPMIATATSAAKSWAIWPLSLS